MKTLQFETKAFARGMFTTAYKSINKKQVKLISTCMAKECMALGFGSDSTFFPTIERVDYETYIMPYYPRVTSLKKSLKPFHYELYKELRTLSNHYEVVQPCNLFDFWHSKFDTISNKRLREALKEQLDGLGNYGLDFGFEISPRNVCVKNGCLILMDVFFKTSAVREVNAARKEKNSLYY